MKHIFIVNKIAGKGVGKNLIPEIEKTCKELKLDYEILITTHKGHATELARNIKPGNVTVYSVGGDGTLLEVANGIDRSIPLGIIPAGSGNDFYRYYFGVCKDLKANIRNTIETSPIFIDIGQSDKMRFLNCTSFGTDAQIAHDANDFNRNTILPKGLSYVAAIIKNIISIHTLKARIIIDGKDISSENYVVAVMNGKYYGNGVKASPESLVNDGFLDLVLFKACSKLKAYILLVKYLNGNHLKDPNIEVIQAKNIVIDTEDPLVMQSDGEDYVSNHLEVKILENYLQIKISN